LVLAYNIPILLKYFLLLATTVFFSLAAYAQEDKPIDGYGIEANLMAGKLIKHNYIFPPIPAISSGIDINILKQTSGKKLWQQRRNYPQIGLGITYTNYGDKDIYGHCIGIYPVIPFHIAGGKRISWDIKLGIGVGYITRSFERQPTWDTINNLIGSKLNNFTLAATSVKYNINEHLSLQAGLTLTHISNGSFRLPNLGLNLATGHIGIRYFPGRPTPKRITSYLPQLKNRWLLQARMSMGFCEMQGNNGPLYPVYMPSLFVSKRYASRNKVFLGVDYSYYKSLEAFLKNNEIHPGEESRYATQACVIAGNEFLIGRFGILLQVGVPFKKTARENDGLYFPKMGYNFYVLQNETGPIKELSVHSYIKANRFEADLIEFGIGVGL
jgi:hypothetical protein